MSEEFYDYGREVRTEAIIDGKTVEYDACATGDLEEAIRSYCNAFKYIGTADGIFVGGEHKYIGIPHHIFIDID